MDNLSSDGPIAWRVSWVFWQGYSSSTKSRKTKPEHKDFLTREEAEAYKVSLISRYTSVTACVSPLYITAPAREREYAGRQDNIAKTAGWPLQARKSVQVP
jgi:hypothetical protein